MSEVTLQQVLQAREDRVARQKQFLTKHNCPLITFTMNIAGPVKTSPLIERGFTAGLQMLEKALPAEAIRERYVHKSSTGWEGYFSVALPGNTLKSLCTEIEEATPLGRLFDMDVLDTAGRKLERSTLRGCFVCGKPGRGCAAGRLHSVEQLQAATRQILEDHFAAADREQIAGLAYESLLFEVNTTPKPGLVDRRNCGSHKDMDLSTFLSSAAALKPYFSECVKIGQETAHDPAEICFSQLRQAGLEAEKAMYRATGGVNTHKGVIYTIGLLCGSIGRLWRPESPIAENKAIVAECSNIAGRFADMDLASGDGSTAGLRIYQKYGLKGIRGEVAAGLPSVMRIGLPVYEAGLNKGLSPNDAGAVTLLHLIANVADTNMYHRGGPEGAAWAAASAKALLQTAAYPSFPLIEELDDAFIARNLSPGGCADLLAVTYFLHSLLS